MHAFGNSISSLTPSAWPVKKAKAWLTRRSEDMYDWAAIDRLRMSGMDLARMPEQGIDPNDFAELLITSGLVLLDEVVWIGHGW